MARYELSIKASYLSGWGCYQGARELIQNARDAEVQFGAPMTVKYVERTRDGKKTGAIVILNDGAVLPKEVMLIGHTTKEGDERLIGKFGEGLKFGLLALLRLGVEIRIRNGSQVWVPAIERSEKYNADVLVFNVTTGHKDENRVQIEVVGIEQSDWEDISSKLLFIGKYPDSSIEVQDGHILTSPQHRGQVFVKGMFVAQTNSVFGYDFNHADIDRDRRMINDLSEKTSSLLAQAVNNGFLQSQVYRLMVEGSEEVSCMSSWRLNTEGRQAIANEFQRQNPGVIPVERLEQQQELESFGKKAQQVTWNMRTILEGVLGTAADQLVQLRRSDKKKYDLSELTAQERDNLRLITAMVGRACQKLGEIVRTMNEVLVVEFSLQDRLGTYDPNSGQVRLARSVLSSKGKALYVLVHEIAHSHGGDGVRSHEAAIGRLMEKILEEVLQ